jgi:hypothetical protein
MGLPYELAGVASAAVRACDSTASGAGAQLCLRALALCVLVALDPRHCGASQCGFSMRVDRRRVAGVTSQQGMPARWCTSRPARWCE